MSDLSLSICIPTYNFGAFIGDTIDSIINFNKSNDYEIIVLDGGSTDDTKDIIKEKQKITTKIKYQNQLFKGGIDNDINNTVNIASGKYCWLFSADDIMIPGSIDALLKYIQSDYDIYLCEHKLCDFDINPINDYPIFKKLRKYKVFNLSDETDKLNYFRAAKTSEAFFSFLSTPVFRKTLWNQTDGKSNKFNGTCWGHAGRLLSLFNKGLTLCYLGTQLLYKRGDNDSFRSGGIVNRLAITIDGFQLIGSEIFGNKSIEAYHIRRVIRYDISLKTLLHAKRATAISPEIEDLNTLNKLVKTLYKGTGLSGHLNIFIYYSIPRSFILLLTKIKIMFVKK